MGRKRMLADEEPEPRGQVTKCHVCVKSSRVGSLVKCDYCPLSFHLDCLDPPLSEVPRDVWMCPNHVEQFLDNKPLTSTSITERVALWEEEWEWTWISMDTVTICLRNTPLYS